MDHEEYLRRVRSYIKTPTKDMEQQLDDFCSFCTYVSGQYDQDDSFINLRKHLEQLENGRRETNRVFYMALPPSVFITVSQHLRRNCYPKNGIARIIVSFVWTATTHSFHSDHLHRSRSPSERTLAVQESSSRRWDPTGLRMRSSASTITWAKRWSRTF